MSESDDEIYDVGPTQSQTVTDIRKLRERFEQKSAVPSTRPKPKVAITNGAVPILPDKNRFSHVNSAPPLSPTKPNFAKPTLAPKKSTIVKPSSPTKQTSSTTVTKRESAANSKDNRSSTRTSTRSEIKRKSCVKPTGEMVGADGLLYRPNSLPTPPGKAPPRPKRPVHIILPDYAVSTDLDDSDDLYDEVGVDPSEPGIASSRFSVIPDMTEEEEWEYEKRREMEAAGRSTAAGDDDDDDGIYETFEGEENGDDIIRFNPNREYRANKTMSTGL